MENTAAEKKAWTWWAKLIGIVIVAALLIALIAQNLDRVAVNFWFWTFDGPLVVLVVVVGVLGVLLGLLLARARSKKTKTGS